MRFLRSEIRQHRRVDLTVPQLRALAFLSNHDAASLAALAEHLGLSWPAASRMVDTLVRRGLVTRAAQAADRRRIAMSLTARGRAAFDVARSAAQAALAARLASCTAAQRRVVSQAMDILHQAFAGGGDPEATAK